MLLKFSDDPAENAVLNMINGAVRTVSEGIEAALLKFKWSQAGFPDADLARALKRLIDGDMLEVVADKHPSLRFTDKGYEHITQVRHKAAIGDFGDYKPRQTAPVSERENQRTEYALRNQVLDVYRELKIEQGGEVIARTLARFWMEANRRSEDLRLSLDLLVRDGHLEMVREEFATYFRLTRDGAMYARGKPAPRALTRLARTVVPERSDLLTPGDGHLMKHLIRQFSSKHPRRTFSELIADWSQDRLPRDLLIHGLDLLLKDDFLSIEEEDPLLLRMTRDGEKFREKYGGMRARWATKQAMDDAQRLEDADKEREPNEREGD